MNSPNQPAPSVTLPKPLPEHGTKSDFKQAVFRAVPPRPFFHRRSPFKQRYLRYCVISNSMIILNNWVSVAVNVYCGEATFWNVIVVPFLTVLLTLSTYWAYRTAKRTEDSLEDSFYKFVDHLAHLEICPRNAPETWLEVWNTHRLMANMIRRRNRTVDTSLKVWLYNLLHRKSQMCNTCLQIQHAYRNDNCEYRANKKHYKFENCPFCACDY